MTSLEDQVDWKRTKKFGHKTFIRPGRNEMLGMLCNLDKFLF